jgi:hypothetical protein
MNEFLDMAVSLKTKSFTLFAGTGFSKYLTNGSAPSWKELLVKSTEEIDDDGILIKQLFEIDDDGNATKGKFDLTICAQILEFEYKKRKLDLKEKVVEIINELINEKTIDAQKLDRVKSFFLAYPDINIVTTNFDNLFSKYVVPDSSRVIIEGSTIPRINSGQNIYHIHGSIVKPESIILTLNDYYNFQNSNNYFSRKFYTLLQETTVAILGYSLGDFNLNTILSEVKNSKKDSFRKTDIYYISKDSVPDVIKKFYALSYGIQVIPQKTINSFLVGIETQIEHAVELLDQVKSLSDVVKGEKIYEDEFLKLRTSLFSILIQASSLGFGSSDLPFLEALITILNRKVKFTREGGAWIQYEHLADWLVEVATTVVVRGTKIEEEFCSIVTYSFKTCSRKLYKGYSWYAWKIWNSRWHEMKLENQIMLVELIENGEWSSLTEITQVYK